MKFINKVLKRIKDRCYGEPYCDSDLKQMFQEGFKYAIKNQGEFEVGKSDSLLEYGIIKNILIKFWDSNTEFLFEPVNSTIINRIEDQFNLTYEDNYVCLVEIVENYEYLRFRIYSLETNTLYNFMFNFRTIEIN